MSRHDLSILMHEVMKARRLVQTSSCTKLSRSFQEERRNCIIVLLYRLHIQMTRYRMDLDYGRTSDGADGICDFVAYCRQVWQKLKFEVDQLVLVPCDKAHVDSLKLIKQRINS